MYDCGIQIPGAGNCKVSKTLGNKPFPNKQMKMFGDSRDKISYTSRRCHGRLLHTKKTIVKSELDIITMLTRDTRDDIMFKIWNR